MKRALHCILSSCSFLELFLSNKSDLNVFYLILKKSACTLNYLKSFLRRPKVHHCNLICLLSAHKNSYRKKFLYELFLGFSKASKQKGYNLYSKQAMQLCCFNSKKKASKLKLENLLALTELVLQGF